MELQISKESCYRNWLTSPQSFRTPFWAEKQGWCCAVCARGWELGTDGVKLELQGREGAQRLSDMGFLSQGDGGGGCFSLRPFLYHSLFWWTLTLWVMLTRFVCFRLSLRWNTFIGMPRNDSLLVIRSIHLVCRRTHGMELTVHER